MVILQTLSYPLWLPAVKQLLEHPQAPPLAPPLSPYQTMQQQQYFTVKYLVTKGGRDMINALNRNGFTTLDLIYNSPRDIDSLQILTFLLESGSKRSEPESSSISNPTPPKKKGLKKLFCYTRAYTSEVDSLRGPLMITAAVLAGPAFQVGVNPPQDGSDMTSVWNFMSISLACSLAAIALLLSGIPLRKSGLCVWIVISLFLGCIVCIVTGYWGLIISTESRYSSGIDVTTFACLGLLVVLAGVGLLHLVRIIVWVSMKVVKCRNRRRRSVSRRGDKNVSSIA